MFKVIYHPRALRFLKRLPPKETKRVLEKIDLLIVNPSAQNLDIKKLATTKRSYRLRIGNLRLIYEADWPENIIYIHEIGFRGDIY